MRVLLPIHIDRWTNPIATLLREIACHLIDIDFFTFSSPQTDEDRELGKAFWSLQHIHKISAPHLLLLRYDVVHHASSTPANLTAAFLAKIRSFGRALHVFTANVEPHSDDFYIREYAASVRRADVVVAVSQAVANSVERVFGRHVDAIIPNGVDPDFFSPKLAQYPKISGHEFRKPYVLFCGVLTRRKRPDVFIRLAKYLPDISFVIVGGYYRESEFNYYKGMIDTQRNVYYLGRQPRLVVRDLMGSALALVFPSEIEGLPLTVIEALAMGLPVLAQPKTSLPEVVIPDVTGWLLPEEPLANWAEVIREIASWTDNKRQSFARTARKFVLENYSFRVVAARYKDVYQGAI